MGRIKLMQILKEASSLDEIIKKSKLFEKCYIVPDEEYSKKVKEVFLNWGYSNFKLKNSDILAINANENLPFKKAREIIEFNRLIVNGTPEVYNRFNQSYKSLLFSPKEEWNERSEEVYTLTKRDNFITSWKDKKDKHNRILLAGGVFFDGDFYSKEGLSKPTVQILSIGNKRRIYQKRSFWEIL